MLEENMCMMINVVLIKLIQKKKKTFENNSCEINSLVVAVGCLIYIGELKTQFSLCCMFVLIYLYKK